jgi:hypothetical protein
VVRIDPPPEPLRTPVLPTLFKLFYSVLLGKGKRLFAEGTPPRAFELAGTKAFPSGIVMNAYKAAGRLREGV